MLIRRLETSGTFYSHETRVIYSQDSQPISIGLALAGRSRGAGAWGVAGAGVGVVVAAVALAVLSFGELPVDFSMPEAPMLLR